MKAYLAVKFKDDYSDKDKIEAISSALQKAGIESVVMVRDYEKWGEVSFTPQELMKQSFRAIEDSDLLIVEFTEKGVGLGIEAGYAHAKGKPVVVIANTGSEISNTLKGIATKIVFYSDPAELESLHI